MDVLTMLKDNFNANYLKIYWYIDCNLQNIIIQSISKISPAFLQVFKSFIWIEGNEGLVIYETFGLN